MATAAKNYRKTGRLPRATTKLSTFMNGMFYTEQIVPDGYAKTLINYDIDYTGNCLKPKMGRIQYDEIKNDYNIPLCLDHQYNNVNVFSELFDEDGDFDAITSYYRDQYTNHECKRIVSTTHYNLTYPEAKGHTSLWLNADTGAGLSIKLQPNINDFMNSFKTIYSGIKRTSSLTDPQPIIDYDITPTGDNKELHLKPAYLYTDESTGEQYSSVRTILLNNTLYTYDKAGENIRYGTHTTIIDMDNNERVVAEYYNTDYIMSYKIRQHYFYDSSLDDSYKLVHDILPTYVTVPDPLYACTSGFNMLLDNPYDFNNVNASTYSCLGGILKNVNTNEITLSPNLGDTVVLNLYYRFNPTGTAPVKVEYGSNIDGLTGNITWKTISSSTLYPSDEPYRSYFTANDSEFILRVTINEGTAQESVWTSGAYNTTNNALKNVKFENIDILDAKQFKTWYNYVLAYDIPGFNTAIYASAPNDPGYFPFPDNVMDFGKEIYAVHNYLNMLLVITSDSIELVTIGDSFINSTYKTIMSNITINKLDALNATVLNDQFCIKIADQFYIFKPNSYTSDATDIKHYLISAPIAKLLTSESTHLNTKELTKILNEYLKTAIIKKSQGQLYTSETGIVGTEVPFNGLNNISNVFVNHITSYTYKDDLHYVYNLRLDCKAFGQSPVDVTKQSNNRYNLDNYNLYTKDPEILDYQLDVTNLIDHSTIEKATISVGDPGYIQLHLVYDITNRTWRMYILPLENVQNPIIYVAGDMINTFYESGTFKYSSDYFPYKNNFIRPNNNDYLECFNMRVPKDTEAGINDQEIRFVITKLSYDSNTYNPELITIPDEINPKVDLALSPDKIIDEHYDIYTYLDTGNISLDDSFMKRFRELQLNLTNYELTKIPFHVNFKLDGQERIDDTNFRIQHITDVNDPDYGLIYITPVEVENLNLYSVTTFADDIEESDCWCLDLSKFPDNERVTLRFGLLGKGRRASVQILNDSLKKYEIADFNWVYRVMNGR